jgi:tetratricopeptide (TPR) repeat protein
MAKPGRNDRCPCGSGKKYKQCCLMKDEAAEREQAAAAQAGHDERAAAKRLEVQQFKAEITASLSRDDDDEDELDTLSKAVIRLIRDGKLDEADAAARDLQVRFPEVPDGWERLGTVHEARGDNRRAADCYRQVIDFIRQHADDFATVTIDDYAARIAKLDPPAAS